MSDARFALNVSVVICSGNRFLLVKRAEDEEFFPGYWGIPGGAVEPTDSSLEDALQRECIEEVSAAVENLKLVSNHIVTRNGRAVLFVIYRANLKPDSPEPEAKDGTEAAEWKTLDEAQKLKLTPKTLDVLELID